MINLRDDKIDLNNKGLYLYKNNRLKFFNKEDISLDILPILLNRIPVTVIFESNGENFDVLYNDVFLLTILKFVNQEISINDISFSELTRPMQRRIEQYNISIIIIDSNQNRKEINSLIQTLKELK